MCYFCLDLIDRSLQVENGVPMFLKYCARHDDDDDDDDCGYCDDNDDHNHDDHCDDDDDYGDEQSVEEGGTPTQYMYRCPDPLIVMPPFR